jgi:hypothetical protein
MLPEAPTNVQCGHAFSTQKHVHACLQMEVHRNLSKKRSDPFAAWSDFLASSIYTAFLDYFFFEFQAEKGQSHVSFFQYKLGGGSLSGVRGLCADSLTAHKIRPRGTGYIVYIF